MPAKKVPLIFRYRLGWHLLFWVVTYSMYVFTYGGYWCHYYEEMILNLTLMPVRIIGTYSLIYLLLPLILKKKKFATFSILAAIHAFVYGFLIWLTLYLLNIFPYYNDYSIYRLFYFAKIFNSVISNYGIPVLAATVIIFKKWYIDEQASRKLAKEKMEAELKFLKSQIHPHFLFNTLNNLYALTLIKSDKTPDIVLKLSGLLDYMLYNSNDEYVALEKEIDILKGYIELESIRYDNRLDLSFNTEGPIGNKEIAPLILLPFIENSFKHGASAERLKSVIKIKITVNDTLLNMDVSNSCPANKTRNKDYAEGIGLKNVRRRLELIYPDAFSLNLNAPGNMFEVNLKIYWNKPKNK